MSQMICAAYKGIVGHCKTCGFTKPLHEPARRAAINLAREEAAIAAGGAPAGPPRLGVIKGGRQ